MGIKLGDDLQYYVLAMPRVQKVEVRHHGRESGTKTTDYYHLLPEYYDAHFGICIEPEMCDSAGLEYYRESDIEVIKVRDVSEFVFVTEETVFFSEGETDHPDTIGSNPNECRYEAGLRSCVDELFDVVD